MSAITADATVFTDPARFAADDDWHRVVAAIRRESPVFLVDVDGFPRLWAITRHADITEIERRHEVFKNTRRVEVMSLAREAMADQPGGAMETLVHMDSPKHRKYRDITSGWFKPSVLRKNMAETVSRLAGDFVQRMADLDGHCDFAADIAKLMPLRVIMGMLGVAEQDEPLMLDLTQRIMGPSDPEYQLTGQEAADHAKTVTEVFAYFGALAEARRRNPTDDLTTVIATSQVDGQPLGDLETLSYFLILAAAGHDTTSMTMAAGMNELVRNPGQLARLKADPALVPNAVEEMLRWASPVKQFTRTAVAEYTVRGVTVRPGERVLLSFQSANRDEDVFADPFTFDVSRPNASHHLAFGSGPHFCLGAPLARMQLIAFFTELAGRIDSAEPAGPVERTHGTTNSGIKRLPIAYRFAR